MVHAGEDVPAIHRQQPTTGGNVDGLRGLLADHWEETGSIHKVSTLPEIVCQPGQPFLPMVLLELLHQSGWTVAKGPFPKHPNDTNVTSIPDRPIVEVISYMFIGG